MTAIGIKNKIMEAKLKLRLLLGNPKQRAKWLENLAGAQASDK